MSCALSPFVVFHQIQLFVISLYSGVKALQTYSSALPSGSCFGRSESRSAALHMVEVPSLL
jgi:hypothetical protein